MKDDYNTRRSMAGDIHSDIKSVGIHYLSKNFSKNQNVDKNLIVNEVFSYFKDTYSPNIVSDDEMKVVLGSQFFNKVLMGIALECVCDYFGINNGETKVGKETVALNLEGITAEIKDLISEEDLINDEILDELISSRIGNMLDKLPIPPLAKKSILENELNLAINSIKRELRGIKSKKAIEVDVAIRGRISSCPFSISTELLSNMSNDDIYKELAEAESFIKGKVAGHEKDVAESVLRSFNKIKLEIIREFIK